MTEGHLKLALDYYKITAICRNEYCETDPPNCLAFARWRAAPLLPPESEFYVFGGNSPRIERTD
jgi:hypothetical protein